MDNVDQPPRAGAPWSLAEETRLLKAVRDGTPAEQLVADFGRSAKALNTRARKMLPYRHPAKHHDDALASLHQLLTDDPTYRPPLGIRDQIRQRQAQTHHPAPDHDLAAIAEALLRKMGDISMTQHPNVNHPERDNDQDLDALDLDDEDQREGSDDASMSVPDFDPAETLPGNPHAQAAPFVDDVRYPAAALREALLAIAFELRTANLIAAAGDHPSVDHTELGRRLGGLPPH